MNRTIDYLSKIKFVKVFNRDLYSLRAGRELEFTHDKRIDKEL